MEMYIDCKKKFYNTILEFLEESNEVNHLFYEMEFVVFMHSLLKSKFFENILIVFFY